MHHIVRKSPGGKLLRLKTTVVEGRLHKPMLAGDFFLMPSEKIHAIERVMHEHPIVDTPGLIKKITVVIAEQGILLAGITPEDIAAAVEEIK